VIIMKKKVQNKQVFKIIMLSVPVIALVIATLAGLDANAQMQIQDVLTQIIVIVAGALGVTGIAMNNDKNDSGE
jgi:uncharacterized membrane protein YtjA (UPF0391 family)